MSTRIWQEVNRYKIFSDGQTEELILERANDGHFRLKNDFGNIVIEFESMSIIEFSKKFLEDVADEIDDDLNHMWFDLDDNDEETDEEED